MFLGLLTNFSNNFTRTGNCVMASAGDVDQFDQYIEYDEDDSSEKENVQNVIVIRQPKTTKDQFNMITTFMEEHSEEVLDKVTLNLLWEGLAAKLNDIGPPEHSVSKWKKIWSTHKYNKKRKLSISDSDTEEPDQTTHPCGVDVESTGISALEKFDIIVKQQSEMIGKQSQIIERQSEMIGKQCEMVGKQCEMIQSQSEIIGKHNDMIDKIFLILQEIIKKSLG